MREPNYYLSLNFPDAGAGIGAVTVSNLTDGFVQSTLCYASVDMYNAVSRVVTPDIILRIAFFNPLNLIPKGDYTGSVSQTSGIYLNSIRPWKGQVEFAADSLTGGNELDFSFFYGAPVALNVAVVNLGFYMYGGPAGNELPVIQPRIVLNRVRGVEDYFPKNKSHKPGQGAGESAKFVHPLDKGLQR